MYTDLLTLNVVEICHKTIGSITPEMSLDSISNIEKTITNLSTIGISHFGFIHRYDLKMLVWECLYPLECLTSSQICELSS